MSRKINLLKKLVKEELKNHLNEGLETLNLTDAEIGLLVAIYNRYSSEGPFADKKNYKYIQPDYAKELLDKYIADPNITSTGKLLAKKILNKFNSGKLNEKVDTPLGEGNGYYTSNEIDVFISKSDDTSPYKPQIKFNWGGDKGEASTKSMNIDCPEINELLKNVGKKQMKLKNLIPENVNLDNVIYRCGWCGLPVDKDGHFLPDVNNYQEAEEYLKKHVGSDEVLVNGECCPEGDGSRSDWDDYHE